MAHFCTFLECLRIKPRAFHVLGKCSTIELHPQPSHIFSVSGIMNILVAVNIFLKRKKEKQKPAKPT